MIWLSSAASAIVKTKGNLGKLNRDHEVKEAVS
jgi:hypothetical protein